MTDFRAAQAGAREGTDHNWDEATKCKECECEEDIFHIPIESKTSCIIIPKSDKRMAYAHSKKTLSCSQIPSFATTLGSFFKKIDNKVAFTMRVEMKVRNFLINYFIFPDDLCCNEEIRMWLVLYIEVSTTLQYGLWSIQAGSTKLERFFS